MALAGCVGVSSSACGGALLAMHRAQCHRRRHRSRALRRGGPLSARVCWGRERARRQPLQWPPPAGPGPLRRTRASPLRPTLALCSPSSSVPSSSGRSGRGRGTAAFWISSHINRPAYPGTDLISDDRTVAYCVPGVHPRIVLSEGTLQLLGPGEIAAVIAHERGHVHERHGLVMLPMLGLKNLFRWIPYARLAPREIATLLEMSADDYSARRYDPLTLAGALVDMAASGCAPRCALSAAGSDVPRRVSRLLSSSRNSKKTAVTSGLLAGAVLVLPLALVALSG